MKSYHVHSSASSADIPDSPVRNRDERSDVVHAPRRLGAYEFIATPPIQLILNAIADHCGVGGTIRPGVRRLAAWANYASAGRISPILDQLAADGWIAYDPSTGLITLLEDPHDGAITERDRWTDSAPITERDRDEALSDGIDTAITERDRSAQCMEDHDLTTSSKKPVVVSKIPCGGESIPIRDHPILLLLNELGATPGPGVFVRGMAARDWTPQQIRDRWEFDQQRIADSRGKWHIGIFWTAFIAGELAPQRPDPTRPIDPLAYAGDPLYRLGSDVTGLPAAPPGASSADAGADETPYHEACRILPPDASAEDRAFVACRLVCGDSPAVALAELEQHRKRVRR